MYYQKGEIYTPFLAGDDTVSVNVTLVGNNYLYAQPGAGATLQYAHYPMGKTGTGALTINGTGSLEVKQTTQCSVNRGACIGGPMLYKTSTGRAGNGKIIFKGGTIKAETIDNSFSAAIGGGSCCPAEMPIIFCGSNIIAKSFNTSATIGAGGGSTGVGAAAHDIQIEDGNVTVYSPARGVGIGGGTSQQRTGGDAKSIKISGGTVTVYGEDETTYGMIGGGTSRNLGVEQEERNGGAANITISGGSVTAGSIGGGSTNAPEAKGGNATIIVRGDARVKTDSIGGGKSVTGTGGDASVRIEGGYLDVQGTIGGGDSDSGDGGNASIYVSGGTLDCASIGGGNSKSGTPGSVTNTNQQAGVVVTGGNLKSGTIGGGVNNQGMIGFATVLISGGNIQGQFVLANTVPDKKCKFTMTGGTIDNTSLSTDESEKYQMAQENGGAVYLSDPNGEVLISGGTMKNSKAKLGGAIYMEAGSFELSGRGEIYDCEAKKGGAVYLEDGTVVVTGGSIGTIIGSKEHPNVADEGAGVYMAGGNLDIFDGQIRYNSAKASGAGAYLAKGNMTISQNASIEHNKSEKDGGGAYLNSGSMMISGGQISNNTAICGAGTYLETGGLTMEGSGSIFSNTASEYGGGAYLQTGTLTLTSGTIAGNVAQNGAGAYLSGGKLQISGGSIHKNEADKGGGAYLANGQLNVSGGTIESNMASEDGGGFYLAGGQLYITDGAIRSNIAQNGAGAYVADSTVRMFGGNITGNQASENGGGIYVSSADRAADVVIRSGSLTNNVAGNSKTASDQGNGGAIAVVSSSSNHQDHVVIGVREKHQELDFSTREFNSFTYDDEKDLDSSGKSINHEHASCPEITGNSATGNGGGIYMNSSSSVLDIYCLLEKDNTATNDTTGGSIMSEGGKVNIGDIDPDGNGNNTEDAAGNIFIQSPMLVKGGDVRICGNAENPRFSKEILVDIKKGSEGTSGTFTDERLKNMSDDKYYVIEYFENFEGSGAYKSLQYADQSDIYADGSLYKHEGYKILGWDTDPKATNPAYVSGTLIGTKGNYDAWDKIKDNGALKLYAIWKKISYTVEYYPNAEDYKGKMESQTFEYGVSEDENGNAIALHPNEYQVTGKRFESWKTEDGKEIPDQYDGNDLSLTDGATVKLYAQWRDCTHDPKTEGAGHLSYTLNGRKNTITETCDCGGYNATVTISGADVYYDEEEHPATLQYSKSTLIAGKATIQYSYKQNAQEAGYGVMPDGTTVPTETGYYKAEITVEGVTAFVTYQIKSPADAATIDVTAQKGQHFDNPTGNAVCTVAQDDAFTVRFNVQGLNKGTNEGADKAYQTAPVLTLSKALPSGTTIIMQAEDSYWYNNDPSGNEIELSSFRQMGGKESDTFNYQTDKISDTQDYRFIIDFSHASSYLDEGDTLQVGLKYTYGSSDANNSVSGADKEEKATITIASKGSFGVNVLQNVCTVTAPSEIADTRWEQKNLVWKITEKDTSVKLPADAKLTMTTTENGVVRTAMYSLNKNGEFVIPVTWTNNQQYTFALSSQQEAAGNKTYNLTAVLCIGTKVDENKQPTALEDNLQKASQEVSLTVPVSAIPALKISGTTYGTQRVLSSTDTLHVHIDYNVDMDEYTIKAIIQKDTGAGYEGNLSEQTITKTGDYAFSMQTTKGSGNYRVWVTVSKNEQTLLEVPYYFIVQ